MCVCVCIGGRGGGRRRPADRNVRRGGRTILVDDRKVCLSVEGEGVIQDSDRTEQWGTCFQNCQP